MKVSHGRRTARTLRALGRRYGIAATHRKLRGPVGVHAWLRSLLDGRLLTQAWLPGEGVSLPRGGVMPLGTTIVTQN